MQVGTKNKSEDGRQRTEVGKQKSEVGSQKPKMGCQELEDGKNVEPDGIKGVYDKSHLIVFILLPLGFSQRYALNRGGKGFSHIIDDVAKACFRCCEFTIRWLKPNGKSFTYDKNVEFVAHPKNVEPDGVKE